VIRSLWAGLNLLVSTLVIGSAAIIAGVLRIQGNFYDWCARTWAAWILWASNTPVQVEGLEHVDPGRPQIFASNHVSWYDVFALAVAIPKRYRFVAKKELAKIPVFGTAWKTAGHIAVDRSDRAAAIRALDEAGRLLKQDNSSVVIFPEGTRSPTGELLPFKKGAFMLAIHSGVDIVPTVVVGTSRILPKGAWRVRPGPIIVRFAEPIRVEQYDESTRDELIEKVRGAIQRMLDEMSGLRRVS